MYGAVATPKTEQSAVTPADLALMTEHEPLQIRSPTTVAPAVFRRFSTVRMNSRALDVRLVGIEGVALAYAHRRFKPEGRARAHPCTLQAS